MAEITLATKNRQVSNTEKYFFRLGLADTIRLTMFGTLVAVANDILRMPLHMPGHTSIWWMGILLIGKGLIKKPGAGTVMGLVSGILAALLGLGSVGVFVFFKYFAPGVMLDLLAPFFNHKFESPIIGAICGAVASLSKMFINIALGMLLKMPLVFLTLGMGITSLSHVGFGALGGIVAAVLIKRLRPRLTNWDA